MLECPPPADTVGARLNKRRIDAGLSIDELARKMGFAGQSSIQRYLTPDYDLELRPDMARKFEAAFGDTKDSVASRIQSRLTALGKNPSVVALEAGMGRSAVRDIIVNDQNPRIDTLRKLTGPLQCTLEYLTVSEAGIPASTTTGITPAIVLRTILCANPTAEQIMAALEANGFKIVADGTDDLGPVARDHVGRGAYTTEGMGARMRDLRDRLGWSQSDLAEKLSVSVQAIGQWETEKTQPTIDNIIAAAQCFGVSPHAILWGEAPLGRSTIR